MQRINKSKVVVVSLTLAMALTNCATQLNNTAGIPKTNYELTNVLTNNSINKINGTVHFPVKVNQVNNFNSLRENSLRAKFSDRAGTRNFAVKAIQDDVKASATVSLLYPADFPTEALRNVTIATGTTNASGLFTVNMGSFTPVTGTVYVLEAVKRLGGAGNYVVTLRTHVRWTGTVWESMTTPDIDLNLVTTGLAIISSLRPQDMPSADTIGKIPLSGGVASVSNINGVVTESLFRSVIALENQVLKENQDPFAAIYFSGGQYLVRHTFSADDTIVNTSTLGNQQNPAIAMDSIGDYVITWESGDSDYTQDGSNSGIYAQRYNYAGRAQGSEFQVNSFTTNAQKNPAIAMDTAGDFVITWNSTGSFGNGSSVTDISNYSINAQRYNSSGAKVGSEFQVNSFTTNAQKNPAIAMDTAGDFVITWQSDGSFGNGSSVTDISGYSINAQRYNSSGAKVGTEFQVNSFTTNAQLLPAIAMDTAGDFVIVWESGGRASTQDGSGYGIYAKRYNTAGLAQGTEFQVNTFTTGTQAIPSIAMDNAGDFVIAWHSAQDGGGGTFGPYGVYAQRYNSDGSKPLINGSEFQVNSFTAGPQGFTSVAMDNAGDFIVAWGSGNNNDVTQDGSAYGVYAQRYSSIGSKVGSEFQVNSFTTSNQFVPSVAMDSAGDFVVAWQSKYQEGGNYGVIHKRYNLFGVPQ